MKLVALSGGIASGKSTIAQRLVELGAKHIDADLLAREAVAPGSPGLQSIVAQFGADILTADGELDRAALGAIVFSDPEALATLNGIIHPEVRRIAETRLAEISRKEPESVVIYDVPLLVEASVKMKWDLVVIAEAPEATRVRRMTKLRGMTRDEALKRISSQSTDEERRAIADVVIDTGGSLEHTLEQTDALWLQLAGDAGGSL